MPTPAQIVDGLAAIATEWRLLAMFWHGYFAVLGVTLAIGKRPTRKLIGILLTLPVLSVSALAWGSANPFNGLAFIVIGSAMLMLAMQLQGRIRTAPTWSMVIGIAMFGFGWIYPHFLPAGAYITYLFAAPTGLIPCPTLSIVIGISLIVNGLDSRAWSFLLATSGLFYGVVGGLVLRVSIDWILMIGALSIFVVAVRARKLDRCLLPEIRR